MELTGEAYLFNLSLLAITFAAVSVLVMLMRQTMGGKLSNFDIHLITSYVARGFAVAIAAVLPPLAADFGFPPAVFWAVTSGTAAVIFAADMIHTQLQRDKITGGGLPRFLVFAFSLQWLASVLLAANAVIPQVQGMALYKGALTLSLAIVFWAFVRRIASLLGQRPSEDWDPKRG